MKFLILDSLALVFAVIITELFWLGKAGLGWLVAGYALVMVLQLVPMLVYKEEINHG